MDQHLSLLSYPKKSICAYLIKLDAFKKVGVPIYGEPETEDDKRRSYRQTLHTRVFNLSKLSDGYYYGQESNTEGTKTKSYYYHISEHEIVDVYDLLSYTSFLLQNHPIYQKMPKLIGTEKQVNWAIQIMIEHYEYCLEHYFSNNSEYFKLSVSCFPDKASYWIDNRDNKNHLGKWFKEFMKNAIFAKGITVNPDGDKSFKGSKLYDSHDELVDFIPVYYHPDKQTLELYYLDNNPY